MSDLKYDVLENDVLERVTSSGLVSFFNGISNFVGYLMSKPFFKKNSSGTI